MSEPELSPTTPVFDVRESDLVKAWGIPRSKLREMRAACLRGTDWTGDPKGVLWTRKGADRLGEMVGIVAGSPLLTVAQHWNDNGVVTESMTVESKPQRPLRIAGAVALYHFANRFLIQARRPNGEVVYVRVPDSSKFTTRLVSGHPMTLLARWDADQWHLAQRAPRFKGRW